MKCEECFYFESMGNNGYCHESPPSPDGQGLATVDEHSVVRAGGWCGKYKRKDKK